MVANKAVELPRGMAGLQYPITQISLAVRDLDGLMARYHRAFGWAPWQVFDHVPPVHHNTHCAASRFTTHSAAPRSTSGR